jgi:hypothetical protein
VLGDFALVFGAGWPCDAGFFESVVPAVLQASGRSRQASSVGRLHCAAQHWRGSIMVSQFRGVDAVVLHAKLHHGALDPLSLGGIDELGFA